MSNNELTAAQQIQEDEYEYPYHWGIPKTTQSGRLYYGYMDVARGMSEAMKKSSSVHILDVGCGDARFLKELQDKNYSNLHGIDYSERAIAFAKLLLPKVTFSAADLTKGTTYQDNSFDVIFMIETLEHIIPEQIPPILKEIRRMLKPGGEFIVTVPSDAFPPGPKHYQHFSAQSLTDTLSPFFDVVEIVGQDKMGFHPLKLYDKLIDNKMWTIKNLSRKYNLTTWPQHFNQCKNNKGRRVVSRAVKSLQ
jgi:ubiquinone/menaquinone biosynthesis C-methylase UbiE